MQAGGREASRPHQAADRQTPEGPAQEPPPLADQQGGPSPPAAVHRGRLARIGRDRLWPADTSGDAAYPQ